MQSHINLKYIEYINMGTLRQVLFCDFV